VAAPRGIEDPISALFDLSDRAAAMAPVVRRLYRYTAAILAVWFVVMVILIVVGLGSGGYLSILALGGLAAGVIAFGLLRQTDRFFHDFVQRHRWIRLLQDAEPGAKVPAGRTPVERLGRYLAQSNPVIEAALREAPDSLRYRAGLRVGDREVPFDLVLVRAGSSWWRWTGFGEPGFSILARQGPDSPTIDDLKHLEADSLSVARTLGGRLCRVILLRGSTAPLADAAYEYAVGHPVELGGSGGGRATLEVITENPDGTYDFVPHVLGVP
jgi:hypothetical protein